MACATGSGVRIALVHYTYLHPILKRRVLCGDITKFINHSETPNIEGTNEPDGGFDVALRDIEAGEELTVDYREYTYAAGKFPGGFIKREGRPTEREILTSRVIARPVRPPAKLITSPASTVRVVGKHAACA